MFVKVFKKYYYCTTSVTYFNDKKLAIPASIPPCTGPYSILSPSRANIPCSVSGSSRYSEQGYLFTFGWLMWSPVSMLSSN